MTYKQQLYVVQQLKTGLGRRIDEVSRSYTIRHTSDDSSE
jgi:hypothetical protein